MADKPQTNLNQYQNDWYNPGAGPIKRLFWFFINAIIIQAKWIPSSGIRVFFMKRFGANIGQNVVIRPGVNIKYPWNITIDSNVWVGENAWLDSLDKINIASHCCISQGAYLCTGNHDWTDPAFGLIIKPITLEQGAWVGAKATVLPGITIHQHAILTAGSVATKDLPEYQICQGNPATPIKERIIKSPEA